MHCRNPLLAAALVLLLIGIAAPVRPQNRCEQALREAERSYRAGRIREVLSLRETCLEGRSSRAEKARAQALLAKVYLALDEPEKAAAAIEALVKLVPDFAPDRSDSPGFLRLLAAEKAAAFTVRVGTVSKTDEPLREAPASVVVLDSDEITRRGYLDLAELLSDLPGFDVSRGNGDVYANIYMRGYRSDRSDRMLFLIDGVEQNDLHSNTAYISRQVPLSNIEQVEVVYGPASTIYGPNAFTGVISITTKIPEGLIEEGKRWGTRVQLAGGSFNTGFFDATVAGRSKSGGVRFSLTGRRYCSDEPNLSDWSDWDYDLAGLDALDYREIMRIEGSLARELAGGESYLDFFCAWTGYCEIVFENGEVSAIEVTAAGAEEARRRDRALYDLLSRDRDLGFSDATDDWAIDAKLHVANLVLGVQRWRREEGTAPWYTDLLRLGRDDGNVWTPEQTAIYARYAQPLGRTVLINLFSRFKQHELSGGSGIGRLLTYGGRALDIVELAALDTIPSFQVVSFGQRSTQFRNELTVVYEPSDRFDLVGGIELRTSSIQIDFTTEVLEQTPSGYTFYATQLSDAKIDQNDYGLFAQASYKPRQDLKIVLGGRVDTRRVRGDEAFVTLDRFPTGELSPGACRAAGLGPYPCDETTASFALEEGGTVFNPRLAVVHTRGRLVVKAVYAEAFKEPSNFQQYTREPGVRERTNPELASEKVRNFELGLSYHRGENLYIDVAAYQADYSDAAAVRTDVDPLLASDSGRFENTGSLRIRGLMVSAAGKLNNWDFYGNYTWTDPQATEPTDTLGHPIPELDELRIGDIASHRLNLGLSTQFRDRWDWILRTNYVGDRPTGDGTTVYDNPFNEIDSYFVAHTTLSYQGLLPGVIWQLAIHNLFDAEYYHPGVQRAGRGFAARLPQPGRALYLRLLYRR